LKHPKHAKRRRITAAAVAATLGTAGALISATAGSSAAAALSSTALPATAGPAGQVTVPQGIGPAVLKHATPLGDTPGNTPETVSFVLQGRNLGSLKTAVETGNSPDLSVSQFAAEYGQTPAVIAALRSYLAGYGITTTQYADRLDVTANGTAAEFDLALTVQEKQYSVAASPGVGGQSGLPAQQVYGTTDSPQMPASIGTHVLAILGLTNYSPFTDELVHTPKGVRDSDSVTPSDTYTGNLTPADFATNYDLTPLYTDGMTGQGETIGIVTLAGFAPATATYFWHQVLNITTAPDRIMVRNVDGGPGAPSDFAGSGESDLDVEQSGAIAPDADIIVYQAPNTDFGFADAFFDAASQNTADTVSSSWGESETLLQTNIAGGYESPAYMAAFDEAFLEMAAQDQSNFIAAGDAGAYQASSDLGTTNLSVDNPDDSPFVTAAGGSTLGGTISSTAGGVDVTATIPAQRAWGWDWLWPDWAAFGAPSEAVFAEQEVAGGGGGFSALEATPVYQEAVPGLHHYSYVQYLKPTDYTTDFGPSLPTEWNFNASPNVRHGTGTGRAMPDLVADADPFTGYLLYDPLSTPALQSGWGGTSFVAPQLNGSTALIDEYVGHRVGLWNPAIYAFAQSGNSPFTPLSTSGTSNDNLYYTGTSGQVFNAGTGLGYPDLGELADDFAS
jgi:kumamolisin